MNKYEKLALIQQKIDVPKDLYNKYGDFKYRSCESILNKAKPLCIEQSCLIFLTDEVIEKAGKVYVQASAVFTDYSIAEDNMITVKACARESEERKGFDPSQLTGSASSYARKYALNGLLDLDDIQDADTINNKPPKESSYTKPVETKRAVNQTETARKPVYKCYECGAVITDKVAQYSQKHLGKCLCYDCQKKGV